MSARSRLHRIHVAEITAIQEVTAEPHAHTHVIMQAAGPWLCGPESEWFLAWF